MNETYPEKLRALPEGRRLGVYFLFCLAATLLVTGAAWLDRNNGLPPVSLGMKALAGVGALLRQTLSMCLIPGMSM